MLRLELTAKCLNLVEEKKNIFELEDGKRERRITKSGKRGILRKE